MSSGSSGSASTGASGRRRPEWWPLKDDYWLVGGWGTGATLIGSAFIALGMIIYSFRKFRGKSEEQIAAEVEASSRG